MNEESRTSHSLDFPVTSTVTAARVKISTLQVYSLSVFHPSAFLVFIINMPPKNNIALLTEGQAYIQRAKKARQDQVEEIKFDDAARRFVHVRLKRCPLLAVLSTR